MFGHHEENNLPEPDGALAHDHSAPADDTGAGSYIDDVPPVSNTVAPTVTAPAADDTTAISDDTSVSAPVTTAAPTASTDGDATTVAAPNADKLLDIKQQALQQLTPLVGHLEQSPEEKFRTTMMMIQASDNHELVAVAYEAAQQIPEEKVRAQALLDIVNEINYFTHGNTPA